MPHRDLNATTLLLDDVMKRWPATIQVFLRHNMLCVGCLVNPFHTIADACMEYGLDEQLFLSELRRAVSCSSLID
ncbi:MAG: DUF1858 domain-containing protein [Thalassovita sp.]